MIRAIPSSLLTIVLTVMLWFTLLVAGMIVASQHDPWLNEGRVWPYLHGHLIEAYAAGDFKPEQDWLFLAGALIRNVVALGIGTAVVAHRTRSTRDALIVAFCSIATIGAVMLWLQVALLARAVAIELLFASCGTVLGLHRCRRGSIPSTA